MEVNAGLRVSGGIASATAMPSEQVSHSQAAPAPQLIDVSIICVNWNSADVLRACIASIYQATEGVIFEIIVVDNASPEGGIDELGEEFPDIKLIKSEVNLGFAKANNLGFEKSIGSHLLFLNPDTIVVGSAVRSMMENIRQLPDAGILGCKLLNSDLSLQTSCIQPFPTIMNQLLDLEFLRMKFPRFKFWGIAPLFSKTEAPTKVEVVSGACMLIRRDVFERVGRFSTEYFMYAEDLDLCYKATQLGFSNYYIPDVSVIHHGGKSTSKQGGTKLIEWSMVRKSDSVMRFCAKTRGLSYAKMYRLAMMIAALSHILILVPSLWLAGRGARRDYLRSTLIKWQSALKWAVGAKEVRLSKQPITLKTEVH